MRSSTSELHVGARAPNYVILTAGWTCYRVVERDDFRFSVPQACTAPAAASFAAKEPRAPRPSGAFRAYLTV